MTAQQYALLAGGMKYVFVLLFVIILVRTARSAWAEYRQEKLYQMRNPIGDTVVGFVSELDNWIDDGEWIPIGEETLVGSKMGCDIRLTGAGVRPSHVRIYTDSGGVLHVERLCAPGCELSLDGEPVVRRAAVPDGAHLSVGDTTLIITYN
ncbi:MAG: hypothetical protein ACOX88_06485 [Christensenellales bacterium]